MNDIKRAPACGLTVAEMAEKPPAPPTLRDLPAGPNMPHGGAGAEVARLRSQIRELEHRLTRACPHCGKHR